MQSVADSAQRSQPERDDIVLGTADESKAPNAKGPTVGPSTSKRKRDEHDDDEQIETAPKRRRVADSLSQTQLNIFLMTDTTQFQANPSTIEIHDSNGFDATGCENGSTMSSLLLVLLRILHSIHRGVTAENFL